MTDSPDARGELLRRLAALKERRPKSPHQPTFRTTAPPGLIACFWCERVMGVDEMFDGECGGEPKA